MIRLGSKAALVLGAFVIVACGGDDGVQTTGEAPATEGAEVPDAGPAPDTEAPPSARSSGGSGGITCDKTLSVSGRAICVATVGAVEIKILAPPPKKAPVRLGLYVHGDGAGAHKSGSALGAMVAWSDAKPGLAVSVLAPNGCSWWQTPGHDCATNAEEPDTRADNAKALLAVVEALLHAYDVRLDGFDYYGSSGGSIFLTDQWLPLHGGTYPGIFALMCGGRAPGRDYTWDVGDASLVARSPLFFTYGDQDFLAEEIEEGMASFDAKRFAVTKKVLPGVAHCAFDAHGEAVGIWQKFP